MIHEQFQVLKAKRWILPVSLLCLAAFIILPSWNHHRREEKLINAQRQAEVLGYQAFEIYRESLDSAVVETIPNQRGIASVATADPGGMRLQEAGSIGLDPWGQPYKYKFLTTNKDQLKVQIWSAGPNKRFETADVAGVAADVYSGDDVGIVLSMTPKASK